MGSYSTSFVSMPSNPFYIRFQSPMSPSMSTPVVLYVLAGHFWQEDAASISPPLYRTSPSSHLSAQLILNTGDGSGSEPTAHSVL